MLHQYELAVRHESAQFGLNLILGLSHAVNHEVNLEEALRIQALIDRFNKDRESSPNLLIDMIQKYLLVCFLLYTTLLLDISRMCIAEGAYPIAARAHCKREGRSEWATLT